jgi:hypothetical protein
VKVLTVAPVSGEAVELGLLQPPGISTVELEASGLRS